ncbi:GNAT family N-acetyltransferase [uncultured Microbulbifer sp.]|uniref:GNAT family N-acetyltransferase n=1 Tax=uncultured Microbulbifer sp. TaxID=348147 RepID=UPI00261F2106|nr:GNAT family N-acetyltransferase [uncultured Microbulbifer sp.]
MDVKIVSPDDAYRLSKFYEANESHLRAWEPTKEKGFHSVKAWKERLQDWCSPRGNAVSVRFISTMPEGGEVAATCSLTNIVRGPFMACHMGYSVDQKYEGKGVMKALCQNVINYAFEELSLNRVMANYMPRNHRSAKLLQSLGFCIEGEVKRYLQINGVWEDHVLTSLLNPGNT